MNLRLQNVLPLPLTAGSRASAVWRQTVSFNKAEKIFVRAPSGTGKTTLIHSLYGLRRDYTGSIFWEGAEAQKLNAAAWAVLRSKNVSVIFQDMRLMPQLTAWENLEIKRTLTNTISAAEAESWMAQLGIAGKMQSSAGTLSYGEQQRLSIVRALLQPFSWLLMDEPFSHLDDANKEKAAVLIKEVVNRNGASLLLADLDDNDYFSYTQKLLL